MPGFSVRPPRLINADLIPNDTRALLDRSWRRGVFPAAPLGVLVVENGVAVGETHVFDANLDIVEASARWGSAEESVEWDRIVHEARARGELGVMRRAAVMAKNGATPNYFHIMMEMLPRSAIAETLFGNRQLTHIVHPSRLLRVWMEALELAGVDGERIALCGAEPVRFDRIVVFDGLVRYDQYMSPYAAEAVAGLGRSVPPGPHRRIHARRGASAQRALLNEAELERFLSTRGFQTVDCGTLSLREQITAFKGAEIVIGPLGAALTNAIFCAPGTRLIVPTASDYPDLSFWFISQHRGLDYTEIRCRQMTTAQSGWHEGFWLDHSDFDAIERLL